MKVKFWGSLRLYAMPRLAHLLQAIIVGARTSMRVKVGNIAGIDADALYAAALQMRRTLQTTLGAEISVRVCLSKLPL